MILGIFMRLSFRRSACLGVVLILAACGAYYKTDYRFVAPSTPQGLQCASVCLQNQQNCGQACATTRSQCETVAQVKSSVNLYGMQQYSQGKAKDYPALASGLSGLEMPSCKHINHCEDDCAATYRDCFTVCGGQVIPYQVCTSNCQ